MGKRKRGGTLEDLMAIGSRLPWKLAVAAAVVSFVAFHSLAGIDVGTATSTKDVGSIASKQIFRMAGVTG